MYELKVSHDTNVVAMWVCTQLVPCLAWHASTHRWKKMVTCSSVSSTHILASSLLWCRREGNRMSKEFSTVVDSFHCNLTN